MRIALCFALAAVALSATREDKLVDALINAQRRVERDMAISEERAAAAQAHCQSKGLTLGTKRTGIIGCVPPQVPMQPKPAAAPTTNQRSR